LRIVATNEWFGQADDSVVGNVNTSTSFKVSNRQTPDKAGNV